MIQCLFLSFLIMLLIGVPISVTLVLASSLAMVAFSNLSLDVVVRKLFSASNSFPLVAIPFFIMAGNIMSKGGMSDRLIKLAMSVIGNIRGGLAMATIAGCGGFGAVCGSSVATAST